MGDIYREWVDGFKDLKEFTPPALSRNSNQAGICLLFTSYRAARSGSKSRVVSC
jgi:hypothetical protein